MNAVMIDDWIVEVLPVLKEEVGEERVWINNNYVQDNKVFLDDVDNVVDQPQGVLGEDLVR